MLLTKEREIDEVVRLRDEEELTFEEIAERLQFSERTARRRYEAGILQKTVDHLIDDEVEDFPEVEPLDIKVTSPWIPENKVEIDRLKPLVVVGNAMIICDLHIPLHDPKLINTMINCARENGIKKLVIAGDYFHMETFGSYLPFQPEAALEVERHDGNYILKALLKTFEEIVIIWGNHDYRLTRKLGFKKSFIECMKWMLSSLSEDDWKKITISDLDYMYYYPQVEGDNKWRICHPRNFSSVPLTVGRKMAQKYNCNVITAHSHHFAMGASPNGKDIVIEGGGFYHKGRTEYIQKSNTNHEWVPGFTMFKDGIPNLISPLLKNTKKYEKEVIS